PFARRCATIGSSGLSGIPGRRAPDEINRSRRGTASAPMIVKVCGITRREDALAAGDAGGSAIGFIFYKPRPPYAAAAKTGELGDGIDIWKVGVFVDESPASVESVMRAAGLDVAQVYGGLAPQDMRVWLAIRVGAAAVRPGTACEALFLDSSGNGVSFDWRVA